MSTITQATQTTLQLLQYYSSLLIFQYIGLPKATGTVQAVVNGVIMPQITTQQIAYSESPTGGTYTLSYNGNISASIAYNATDTDIQTALRALPDLASVTVLDLLVTFIGVYPPALSLVVGANSLQASGTPVSVSITETDLSLPLAVLNGFNLIGPHPAVGVQLDILGIYAGVTRSGIGATGPITLDDADFLTLIQFATIQNNAGSDLSSITTNLFNFFGLGILVFDYQNMHMSYLINSSVGSQDLIELLIAGKLLPQPMTVQLSIIYAPIIDTFFGFVTYQLPIAANISPFNTYQDYITTWPWLDYADAFAVLTSMETEDGMLIVQENGDTLYYG